MVSSCEPIKYPGECGRSRLVCFQERDVRRLQVSRRGVGEGILGPGNEKYWCALLRRDQQ